MPHLKKRLKGNVTAATERDLIELAQTYIPDIHYYPLEQLEQHVGDIDTNIFIDEDVHEVPLSEITLTQNIVRGESFEGDNPVSILKYEGDMYLIDGHHRFAEALQNGEDSILAHVLDLDRFSRF
jgi:hypothetical protein